MPTTRKKEKEKKANVGKQKFLNNNNNNDDNNNNWGYFFQSRNHTLPQFSSHFGEKIFWWAHGENTCVPPHFFFLLPIKHIPKSSLIFFSFHFS